MDRRGLLTRGAQAVLVGLSTPLLQVGSATSQATPDATPVFDPVADGVVASVARLFTTANSSQTNISSLEARVTEFENPEQAQGIASAWFDQIELTDYNDYEFNLSPVAIDTVADSTRAAIGRASYAPDDDYWWDVTAIAVTSDALFYGFLMFSKYQDGIEVLLDVARRTLGLARPEFAEVPDIPYNTGGLWDLLPRIEHMPAGLTWNADWPPCTGIFGVNECEPD